MGFWSVMNYVAWGLCVLFTALIVTDFIRVEKEQRRKKNENIYLIER